MTRHESPTRTPLAIASALEVVTGLALLIVPAVVVRLLLGGKTAGAATAVGRVAGIGLLSLGIACRPRGATSQPLKGMLTYNALVATYLAYLGRATAWAGKLLWPAVAVHGALTVLLSRAWFNTDRHESTKGAIR